jgi:hypothetical protein
LTPQFRISQKDGFWVLDVFYITTDTQQPLFADWGGFEEPFNETDYQKMAEWCYHTFKTWLTPKRARRMGYNQFFFKSKKDADWFILHWSGVDISVE